MKSIVYRSLIAFLVGAQFSGESAAAAPPPRQSGWEPSTSMLRRQSVVRSPTTQPRPSKRRFAAAAS